MAAQPQVFRIELVPQGLEPMQFSDSVAADADGNQFHNVLVLRLEPAIGQPEPPVRPGSKVGVRPMVLEIPGSQHKKERPQEAESQPDHEPNRGLSVLEKVVALTGLVFIIAPLAAVFGVPLLNCALAQLLLGVAFVLVFGTLLFVRGRLSVRNIMKLWKACMGNLQKVAGEIDRH